MTGQIEHFLYAALELRIAIEARLHESIGTSIELLSEEWKPTSEYAATRLLRRLGSINPAAHTALEVQVKQDEKIEKEFAYQPVTQELAALHGKLGELLHYNFFLSPERVPKLTATPPIPAECLAERITTLKTGISELERSMRSNLMLTPSLVAIIQEFMAKHGSQP